MGRALLTMACWNCSSIFSSSSAGTPTTAQPHIPGASSIALDRTSVRLQSRAYTRPASIQVSYSVLKFAEVGTETAFHRPPEMPIRCVSGLPSPGLSNSGSRFAVLHNVSNGMIKHGSLKSGSGSGRSRIRTLAEAPLSRHRAALRGPCRPRRPNGDIFGRVLESWNKLQSFPSKIDPFP